MELQSSKTKTLYDLKRAGLINFSNSFGGGFSDMDKFETGLNKIFLEKAELNTDSLKIYAIDNQSKEVSQLISSNDKTLLAKIEKILNDDLFKSLNIGEIYNTKLF
ncbi:MAG: hypothetical protein PHW01_05075 [Patescibacteria group bacterium]|nr:hypothetical protein [Patescibacteria group bacterium]